MSCTMPASRASSSPTMSLAPRPCRARTSATAPRTSGARLVSNRKAAPLPAGGGDPVDDDLVDPRAGRPMLGPRDQRVDRLALAFDLGSDGAVGLVACPAADAEPTGFLLHRAAVPDALHPAA